ncbi:hypothetical protein BB8028_0009g01120 [Beauveria bassiana]|uniref:Cytochrome P450 n=1 Tax=Beauveria bassiana TaxID=176275 RepID=A0A2S7YPC0_BEABA|nr:hypothetical protein BB8028_0009g01120 [Beauveria bassiana]
MLTSNYPFQILLGVICSFLIALLLRRHTQGTFVDGAGYAMKEIQGDTGARRFTHGQEVSDEGFKVANGRPYVMYNGWRKEVVLCAPEHLRAFFRGNVREHRKSSYGNMGYFLNQLLRHSPAQAYGDNWKAIRSLFDPLFSHGAGMAFLPCLRRDIRGWLQSIPKTLSSQEHKESSFSVDASGLGEQLTLKLLSRFLYGEALADEYFAELRELAQMREELGFIELPTWFIIPSVYKFLPTRANRLLKQFTKGFKEFNLRMIALAEKIALQNIFNVTGPQGQITLEQFLHTVDEILLDNLEVSAAALSYLLINVAGDVQLQQKLRDEARRHLQSGKEQGFEQYLGRSNTLLEFCCAESRRLCPVDWFSPPERSNVDKTVDGYHIPAGTDVTVDITRVNIHSPLWSRPILTPEGKRQVNGYDLYPERFNQIARMESSYNVVGFGVSARQCLGQHFASLLMRVVLVEVVSNYRITTKQRAWDCGFRQDRTVLAPKPQEIVFEELEPLPL